MAGTDWRTPLRKHNAVVLCLLLTLVSLVSSVFVTWLVDVLTPHSLPYPLRLYLIAAVVPLLVAPPAGWLMLGLMHDLEAAHRTLREQAIRDPLTGCLNRGHFMAEAASQVQRGLHGGTPMALLMMDLDRFKLINDNHGHPAGDQALRTAARAFAQAGRSTDLFARYGGEEFVVLLPATSAEMACNVAERLRLVIEGTPVALADGTTLSLTVSLGIAEIHAGSAAVEDALDRADKALYEAKRRGRNRWVLAPAPTIPTAARSLSSHSREATGVQASP